MNSTWEIFWIVPLLLSANEMSESSCDDVRSTEDSVSYSSSHKIFWRLSNVLEAAIYQDIQRITKCYAVNRTRGFCLTFYHEHGRIVDTSE
jgi:hypothetical protein